MDDSVVEATDSTGTVEIPGGEKISLIVFCPVCCSTEDLICEDGSVAELECTSCGQTWTMKAEQSRFDAYSAA